MQNTLPDNEMDKSVADTINRENGMNFESVRRDKRLPEMPAAASLARMTAPEPAPEPVTMTSLDIDRISFKIFQSCDDCVRKAQEIKASHMASLDKVRRVHAGTIAEAETLLNALDNLDQTLEILKSKHPRLVALKGDE